MRTKKRLNEAFQGLVGDSEEDGESLSAMHDRTVGIVLYCIFIKPGAGVSHGAMHDPIVCHLSDGNVKAIYGTSLEKIDEPFTAHLKGVSKYLSTELNPYVDLPYHRV